MPIHVGIHWTCAEVNLQERVVRYYDSLQVCQIGQSVLEGLRL